MVLREESLPCAAPIHEGRLNIWLVTVGEPVPIPGNEARLWRCGLLAKTLAQRGHRVVWWTSTFDHISKAYFDRPSGDVEAEVLGGVHLKWLHGRPYERNISISRLINHAQLGIQFSRLGKREAQRPDVIVVSFPTIELAYTAMKYARTYECPLLVDVRDLWPDIFVAQLPPPLRPFAKFALWPYFAMTRSVMKCASAILAVSQNYLDWATRIAGRKPYAVDAVIPLGYEPAIPGEEDRREGI